MSEAKARVRVRVSAIAIVLSLALAGSVAAQNYHPSPRSCAVSQYYLVFLRGDIEYKLHGLWPNVCGQCTECGYPTCCDPGRLNFTIQNLPVLDRKFLEDKWYRDSARLPCSNDDSYMVSLFEHEYYKHASCIDMVRDTTDFVELAMTLWYRYHSVLSTTHCYSSKQIKLSLDDQFNLHDVIC